MTQQKKEDVSLDKVVKQLEGIYSDEEQEFIRNALKGKMELFKLLRNFFFQAELTDQEKEALKEFATPRWLPLLRRIYFPEIDLTRPLGQVRDIWSYMNPNGREVEDASREMMAREILITYLTERFSALSGEEVKPTVLLADLVPRGYKDKTQNLIELMARSMIMTGIEGSTMQLLLLSNSKKESPEEIATKIKKDSSK